MKYYSIICTFWCITSLLWAVDADSTSLTRYVNPFIGTTNYGTTNPGAVCPNGLMSVTPFNVMGSKQNKFDKDSRWWSTPYSADNVFFTGFSHVNLSGVGCPDLGAILLMPTLGTLNVAYNEYGSNYTDEYATTGYYTNRLTKYNIKTEVTATNRSSIARFTYPKGKANVLLNMGEGLTNQTGGWAKFVAPNEVEGMRLLGGFCYNTESTFPLYFVMRISKQPTKYGFWKKQREMTAEKEWDKYSGKNRVYTSYKSEMAGDDFGVYLTFEHDQQQIIEVQIGVSLVSVNNARLNLDTEQKGINFEQIRLQAQKQWQQALSKVEVEGGTEDEKTIFYSALYHALLHPNLLNDVNGEYPAMESRKTQKTTSNRYTVFSLWDTYRNVHQLLALLYPDKQLDMVRSMIDMYKESGWLPKWELYSTETLTMEGDPAFPVIADTWFKGLQDFDIKTAYQAMYKSATTRGKDNFLRPDNDDYLSMGYVPLREKYDNSVSHALEYYIADNALAKLAKALGKTADAKRFHNQSMQYKKYFSVADGTFRPLLPNGDFIDNFDPTLGMNFEPNPGFHEGTAWNYTFMVPHDIEGLIELYGGEKAFIKGLQNVFDKGYYDPTNEPNIAYPYLFSYVKGEEWRTQKIVSKLLKKHFKNSTDGLPGNDDTGTMSAWAVFSMMGIYPDDATSPTYTVTKPIFDKITIHLDNRFYPNQQIIIQKKMKNDRIQHIRLGNKKQPTMRISHKELVKEGVLSIE